MPERGIPNGIGGIPEDGKLAIAAPHVAALMVEQEPAFGLRVFTMPGIPEDIVYILDIDALNEALRV